MNEVINKVTVSTVALSALLLVSSNCPSFAGKFAHNHPRRAEVLRRDNRLNGDINRDAGRLGGNYSALKTEDQGIRRQEQADAAAHGGHITRQEQQQLNGEENTLRSQISQDYTGKGSGLGGGSTFAQKHPRRAEVLGRDGNLNNMINQDKGQLGGNYSALKTDDRSIRTQEQQDARANGGYITRQQQQQLNQEENQLKQQVSQDYTGSGS